MANDPPQPNFEFFVPVDVTVSTPDLAASTDVKFLQCAVREAYADLATYRELTQIVLQEVHRLTLLTKRQTRSLRYVFNPNWENDEDRA